MKFETAYCYEEKRNLKTYEAREIYLNTHKKLTFKCPMEGCSAQLCGVNLYKEKYKQSPHYRLIKGENNVHNLSCDYHEINIKQVTHESNSKTEKSNPYIKPTYFELITQPYNSKNASTTNSTKTDHNSIGNYKKRRNPSSNNSENGPKRSKFLTTLVNNFLQLSEQDLKYTIIKIENKQIKVIDKLKNMDNFKLEKSAIYYGKVRIDTKKYNNDILIEFEAKYNDKSIKNYRQTIYLRKEILEKFRYIKELKKEIEECQNGEKQYCYFYGATASINNEYNCIDININDLKFLCFNKLIRIN